MRYCSQWKEDEFLNMHSLYMSISLIFIAAPLGFLLGIILGGPMFMVAGWGWAVLALIIGYSFFIYIIYKHAIFIIKFQNSDIILIGLFHKIVLNKGNVQSFVLSWPIKESEKDSTEGPGSSKAPGGGFEAILKDNRRLNISTIFAGYLRTRITNTIGAPVKYEDPRERKTTD